MTSKYELELPGKMKAMLAEIAAKEVVRVWECPSCDSSNGHFRGTVVRKDQNMMHRRRCKDCGRWYYGAMYIKHTKKAMNMVADLEEHIRWDSWQEAFEESCGDIQ